MIKIVYIPHALTSEQERGVASGHSAVGLSGAGVQWATNAQKVFAAMQIDAAYTSDLPRAVQTIEIALKGSKVAINSDARLREVDYGDYTGQPRDIIRGKRLDHIHIPYPHGESYDDVLARFGDFLNELKEHHDGQTVAICGHGIYPLEVLLNGKPIEEALFDWVDGEYRSFTLD